MKSEVSESIRQPQSQSLIGRPSPRVDSRLKVTGRAVYSSDLSLPHMLHAKIKRAPLPHAKITGIDTSRARNLVQESMIVTCNDFPRPSTGDTPPLANYEVLYMNQAVAAVAAENSRTAELAVNSIDVEYQELPAVFDPELAMSDATPTVISHPNVKAEIPNVGAHIQVRHGATEEAMANADYVVENRFTTSIETHFHMEPLSFLARPDADGGVTIWCTTNGAHRTQVETAQRLGMDQHLVRVRVPFVGGWFGAKEEPHLAAICAKLALKSLRPVKLQLSREETITASGVRHPATIKVTDGVSKAGRIVARRISAIYDGGAYNSSIGNALLKNGVLAAAAVYDIPNLSIDAFRVYTNRVPGTQKRAPMGPQMVWAIECQMDCVAHKIGMDGVALRLKNALATGKTSALGETMTSISHEECLLAASKAILMNEKPVDRWPWRRGKGLALAAKWSYSSPHQAMVRIRENGKVEVWADIVENGQGAYTAISQIVATEFGIPIEDVILAPLVYDSGSATTGVSAGASASRQTVNIGNAAILACKDAKKKISELTSRKLGLEVNTVEVSGGKVYVDAPKMCLPISDLFLGAPLAPGSDPGYFTNGVELVGYGTYSKRTGHLDPRTGRASDGSICPYYVSSAQGADVSVNLETGEIKVHKVVAAVDVGKAINPELVRAQIVGSVAMGLGAALSEELLVSEGRITNANLADYKLLSAIDAPIVEAIIIENEYRDGPYGAKSAGEPPILTTAPAIRNAIHDAAGIWLNKMPMTREDILLGFDAKDRSNVQ